jgi:hypothetical protein
VIQRKEFESSSFSQSEYLLYQESQVSPLNPPRASCARSGSEYVLCKGAPALHTQAKVLEPLKSFYSPRTRTRSVTEHAFPPITNTYVLSMFSVTGHAFSINQNTFVLAFPDLRPAGALQCRAQGPRDVT